jgi:hypothetical protein
MEFLDSPPGTDMNDNGINDAFESRPLGFSFNKGWNKKPKSENQRAAAIRSATLRNLARNSSFAALAMMPPEMREKRVAGIEKRKRTRAINYPPKSEQEKLAHAMRMKAMRASMAREAAQINMRAAESYTAAPNSGIDAFKIGGNRNYKFYSQKEQNTTFNADKITHLNSSGHIVGGPWRLADVNGAGMVELPHDVQGRLMTQALSTYVNPTYGPSIRKILYKVGRWATLPKK